MFRQLLQRPIAVIMILTAVIVLGISSINLLPVSLIPAIDIPQITVQISAPNKSARELNESVISPLRQQLIQISHLSNIKAETKDGSGIISMLFDYGIDMDYLFIEVNEKIDRSMNSLPKYLDRPKVMKASATDIPAFYLNISAKGDDNYVVTDDLYPVSHRFVQLGNFVSQVIIKRIEQLSEVAMVDMSGLVYPELLIVPDREKMQMMGISEENLQNAILNANVQLGNLTIRDGEYQFNVRFESNITSKRDIENTYLKINGRIYQLKEISSVHEHPQKRIGKVISDGKDAITLAIIKRSEAKMSDLKAGIETLMSSFEKDYPDIDFTITRDQTELLDYSINNLVNNILIGAILACIIIFFFMRDFKSPLLLIITIPVSLIISMLLFYVIGLTINIISLAGLLLGIGMMVDNSIIVIDNITYQWKYGKNLSDSVVCGTREVFAPMLSSVLTTCAVFIPLIFISGIAGALFYDQAMAVTITLFSSLVVSVLVIPVFYYLFYKKQKTIKSNTLLGKISFENIFGKYDAVLKFFFRRRIIMWGTFILSTLGIIMMFIVVDKEKLPPLSHNDSLIHISWNERISVDENSRRCKELTTKINDLTLQTTIMAGVQQFILSHTDEISVTEAIIYVKTKSTNDIFVVESRIKNLILQNYSNAIFNTKISGNIFDMIFSDKDAILSAHVRTTNGKIPEPTELNKLIAKIRNKIPDTDIKTAVWQEHIEYIARPEIMAIYGISYDDILHSLRNALNDNRIMTITKGNYSVPVVIGENKNDVREMIENNYVSKNNMNIPLGDFVRETRNQDLKNITSGTEGEYYSIELNIKDNEVPSAISSIQEIIANDDQFEVDFSGTYFSNRKMIKELIIIIIISILLLYFILASQFESFIQPFIIISELIIDIFGALLIIYIFGASINLMSLIGIVIMCGIVINDSILKIDTINQIRKQGSSLVRSIFDAGNRRLKPIIMTSLTTIFAIAPFLIKGDMGSDLQYPLSLALIGGMIAGTFVSIFFVPLIYYEIYKKKK
ncbi:MAG: efflux RND transporter permease subunit [Prevotellaceae bacterium]|jgi:multidrug efflux pump subunit AcrB|nr:efflux RND transporter permease subunit [Prevotellaceae bacterium]